MKDFVYLRTNKGVLIKRYVGADTDVVIPEEIDGEKVYAIGDCAFRGTNVKSVFGNSITTICEEAFKYALFLEHVDFPNLKEIKEYAFEKSGIEEINIPKSMEIIFKNAFTNSNLKSVTVDKDCENFTTENGVLIMNDMAVFCPKGITEFSSDNVIACGDYCFYHSDIKNVTLPNLISIGANAFEGTEIAEILFSGKLKDVGDSAFKNCIKLKSIFIPSSVTSLGRSAFEGCRNLESAYLGDGLKVIPSKCFAKCHNLKEVDISYVEKINFCAFYDCYLLADISLGMVKEIGAKALMNTAIRTAVLSSAEKIGTFAFAYCSDLKEVTFSSNLYEIKRNVFDKCFGVNFAQTATISWDEPPMAKNNNIRDYCANCA